jgi:hypothetical protein
LQDAVEVKAAMTVAVSVKAAEEVVGEDEGNGRLDMGR